MSVSPIFNTIMLNFQIIELNVQDKFFEKKSWPCRNRSQVCPNPIQCCRCCVPFRVPKNRKVGVIFKLETQCYWSWWNKRQYSFFYTSRKIFCRSDTFSARCLWLCFTLKFSSLWCIHVSRFAKSKGEKGLDDCRNVRLCNKHNIGNNAWVICPSSKPEGFVKGGGAVFIGGRWDRGWPERRPDKDRGNSRHEGLRRHWQRPERGGDMCHEGHHGDQGDGNYREASSGVSAAAGALPETQPEPVVPWQRSSPR